MFNYCNAGHDPPINITNNEVVRINEGGLLLGCFDFAEFEEGNKSFEVGEIIVVFSDGIAEAMNEFDEEFGEEKLTRIIQSNLNLSSKEIVDIIVKEVKLHSTKVEQSDDITIMVIKRNN